MTSTTSNLVLSVWNAGSYGTLTSWMPFGFSILLFKMLLKSLFPRLAVSAAPVVPRSEAGVNVSVDADLTKFKTAGFASQKVPHVRISY